MILKKLIKLILPRSVISGIAYLRWRRQLFTAPSPNEIKRAVLLRNSHDNACWVETGTFMGDTTLFLSKHANFVYSIEPEPSLYENAKKRFENNPKIEIIHGLSEEVFPVLLTKLNGNVNFWLDGHYSAGVTYKGPQDTPILDELNSVLINLNHMEKVTIFIDDVRCFNPSNPEYSTYPSLDFIVDWARKNNFNWHIEQDIFIARR